MHVADPQLSLSNDHLVELSKSLLAFMPLELRPKLELFIYDVEGSLVVLWELYLFPKLVR